MKKRDIQFLKNLSEELKTQETDHQASPRFWVIAQYEFVPCREEEADDIHYFGNFGSEDYSSFEELLNDLKKEYPEEDFSDVRDWDDLESEHQDLIEENSLCQIPVKRERMIKKNTMFLTKSSAKKHIEENSYHYNGTVHTYAMTAWRSSTVERLLNVLVENNWDELERIATEE